MSRKDIERLPHAVASIVDVIHTIRGQRVMLDADLAGLYGVQTKVLNQAIRRNPERFPKDFMFQLTDAEWEALRSQSVTSRTGRGGRRYAPYAFTQEGVAMLSSVLNSPQAIAVNVEIMRAFVRFRTYLANHQELAAKMKELELRFEKVSNQHDTKLRMLAEAMRQLRDEVRKTLPPLPSKVSKRPIGFIRSEEDETKKGAPKSQNSRKRKKSA